MLMSDRKAIRVGLLGCGTVGTGVLQIVHDNAADIEARLGVPVEVSAIAVSDRAKTRAPIVPQGLLSEDASQVVRDPRVDIVVEVMGGQEPARSLILEAFEAGKHVVTANKALLAQHGHDIFRAADDATRDLSFEASVGGGIPIIRTLREGLASEHIALIRCIINGTSNYILSEMAEGAAYDEALASAQQLGFAEADPTMDVAGFDAAQKLSILIALGWGAEVPFTEIATEGINHISRVDMAYVEALGYTIKPLASARLHPEGIEAYVAPALVTSGDMLSSVQGAYNAVNITSKALGPVLLYGQGAGSLPTAAAVVSDIVELGRNILRGTSGRLPHLAFHQGMAAKAKLRHSDEIHCPFYLRVTAHDEPGVLSTLTGALGRQGVSVSRMLQEETEVPGEADIVMLTHEAREGSVRSALSEVAKAPFITCPPRLIRVAVSP